jgi:hypothetical protein
MNSRRGLYTVALRLGHKSRVEPRPLQLDLVRTGKQASQSPLSVQVPKVVANDTNRRHTMPSKMWDTPFSYDKGNKEFPEEVGKVNEFQFHCDVPAGPSTPIDTPIASMKLKDKAPTTETESADLSTKYNKAEWDTPYKDVYTKGSDMAHN